MESRRLRQKRVSVERTAGAYRAYPTKIPRFGVLCRLQGGIAHHAAFFGSASSKGTSYRYSLAVPRHIEISHINSVPCGSAYGQLVFRPQPKCAGLSHCSATHAPSGKAQPMPALLSYPLLDDRTDALKGTAGQAHAAHTQPTRTRNI